MSIIDDQNARTVRDKMLILIKIKDGSRTYTFTEADIISCELSLQANLDQYAPTLPVSTLTMQAYSSRDLSAAVANMGDGVPVTYSAGYPGDMSPTRTFYLRGRATYDRHVLSLTAEDQVGKLDGVKLDERLLSYYYSVDVGNGRSIAWKDAKSVLTSAGITLLDEDSAPPATNDTANKYVVMYAGSGRETIARYNACHLAAYGFDDSNPVFDFRYVDAGRPSLRWTLPDTKATIPLSDLGELHTSKTRGYKGVRFTDTGYTYYDIDYTSAPASSDACLDYHKSVRAGQILTYRAPGSNVFCGYRHVVASGTSTITYISKQPRSVTLSSSADCTLDIYGRKIRADSSALDTTPVGSGSGYLLIDPLSDGGFRDPGCGDSSCFWPNYNAGITSRERIECVWKGDPRLQPRDVVAIRRGSKDTRYTIESIHTTHRGGGMTQELVLYEGLL